MRPRQGTLIGCAQLADQNPTMLLPLFRLPNEEGLYAQVYDISGPVEDFTRVNESPWWTAPANHDCIAQIGGEPIIAFTDADGENYCGGRSELLSKLRAICGSRSASEAFKLSAYEIIGDHDKIIHHRSKSIENISVEISVESGAAYRNSIATDLLWRILEQNTAGTDSRNKLSLVRGTATAKFAANSLQIDLGLMAPEDFRIAVDEISRRVADEMRGVTRTSKAPPKADLSEIGGIDPAYKDLVQAVDRSKRQEERIAILIRSILLSPRQGMHLLENYNHFAKYEQDALGIIRNAIGRWENASSDQLEIRLARSIRTLITASYPMRKGETIFFFAEHLSDFDYIREQIDRAFRESQAISVNLLRKQIEGALARRNRRGT